MHAGAMMWMLLLSSCFGAATVWRVEMGTAGLFLFPRAVERPLARVLVC